MIKELLVTTSNNAVRTVLAHEAGVELEVIECTIPLEITKRALADYVRSTTIDLIITYRCPIILHKDIYSRARLGAFNIHPSLLPKNSGLNPWPEILRNDEREGGVTLHHLTTQVDGGPIVFQSSFVINETDTLEMMREKSDKHAAILMKKLLRVII